MSAPPRDRWVVVWVTERHWAASTAKGVPAIARWETPGPSEPSGFYAGGLGFGMSDPRGWGWYIGEDEDIAAWAECPARPEEG